MWVEPKHLQEDELEFELKIRCLDFPGMSLEQRQQAFHTEQCKEAHIPRVLHSKKTLLEEINVIQVKLIMIRRELETNLDERLMTRLKHLFLRVERTTALDAHQIQMKDELLEEIEMLFDIFGSDRESIRKEYPVRNRPQGTVHRGQSRFFGTPGSRVNRLSAYEFPPPSHIARSTEIGARNTMQGLNVTATEFRPNLGIDPRDPQTDDCPTRSPGTNNTVQQISLLWGDDC